MKDIELDILPNGQLRFCRCEPEVNTKLLHILSNLGVNNIEDLEEFFRAGNKIEQIFGDEQLCG